MATLEFKETLRSMTATELMVKRDTIEKEIKEFSDILESQKGVGMKGPLVDAEGFPRSDIDVYSVRIARNRIICLRNDHKAVMAEIEVKLHELHAAARLGQAPVTNGGMSGPRSTEVEPPRVFARVNSVAQGSPAAITGLEVDDEVVEFGSVNYLTFKSLQDVGTVVQHSQGRPVRVVVRRRDTQLVLSLTPQKWSGRGLLGCSILPL